MSDDKTETDPALPKPDKVVKEDEVVKLDKAVRAEGSVEIWLMSLLNSAKEALHNIIRSANVVISDSNLDLLDFINKFQAQVSVLTLKEIIFSHHFLHNVILYISCKTTISVFIDHNGWS